MKLGDDRGEFKNLFGAAKSAYINGSESKGRIEIRKGTGFIQLQRTWKIIFPILLPNSIKQIQSILKTLLILGTIHSPRSQIKKVLTYLLLSIVQSTSVYSQLEKHWAMASFSFVLKNQRIRWSISFISSHFWEHHVGWFKKKLKLYHFSHMILIKREDIFSILLFLVSIWYSFL